MDLQPWSPSIAVYFAASRTRSAEITRWDTEIIVSIPKKLSSLIFPKACFIFTYPEATFPSPSSSSKPGVLTYVRFFCVSCYQKHIRSLHQPSQWGCLTTAVSKLVSLLKPEQQQEEGYRLCQPLPNTLTAAKSSPPSDELADSPAVSIAGPVLEAFPGITPLLPMREGQSSHQHQSWCFSVLGSAHRSKQLRAS